MDTGIRNSIELTVTPELTAAAMGSGLLEVFATPAMIALMERTCAESVAPFLPEGDSTVGTELCVKHTSASPVGSTVRCESELVEVDGRRLVFSVTAYDNVGEIGSGTHERFIVTNDRFLAKAQKKLNG